MLRILGKEIDNVNSPILYNSPFSSENIRADWKVYGGEWWFENGWLTGKNPDNAPGMIISRTDFPGDVLLDFEARTVLPSTHDIDFMWNGSWNEEEKQRGTAYVAGIEGWWEGKVGFEKSPGYEFNITTGLFNFKPGQTYHIQAGSIHGHCFIFIDGSLVLEATDPDPIDSQKYTKVGFEAYCSHIQVKNLKILGIKWNAYSSNYLPEF